VEANTGKALLFRLKTLGLPEKDFAVFGSGPLYVRGIKDSLRDLDLIARGKAWVMATGMGVLSNAPSGYGMVVRLPGAPIEIFDKWTSDEWNVDQLIDCADIIDGLRYVNLREVLKWKKFAARGKDAEDIARLEAFLHVE
jgi:hypothetical protein